MQFHVLVVDDDLDTRTNLQDVLELDGYEVEAVGTATEAFARADWAHVGAVILDRQLPDATAEKVLPRLRAVAPDTAVLVVTGYADVHGTIAAFRLGATDYILKPVDLDELRARLGRIAEHRRAREELRAANERLRVVLASITDGYFVLDPDGRFVDVNRVAEQVFFRRTAPELIGRVFRDEFPGLAADDCGRAVRATAASGRAVRFECRARTAGRWFEGHTYLRDGRLEVYLRDISERKKAEETLWATNREREQALTDLRARTEELRAATQQLWQAARLAGVGELAASIAHELNNPLGTVSLRVEGLLTKTPADDARRRSLEIIDQEVERMARLVANLLQFSRAGLDQVAAVDVCDEVRKTIELTEHHLRRRQVRVEPDFAPDVPAVHADRQQLRQVLLNLFTNAADAMPDGGRLIPRVRVGELPPARPAVVIEVTDTGAGIPPEYLPRVTEPFFTTKPEGKGTGLGLAICRRIVQQHQGALQVESPPGEGTTVRIVLPVQPEANVGNLHAF